MKILKTLLFVILIFPLTLQAGQQNTVQYAQAAAQTEHSADEGLILSHRLNITLQPEKNALKVSDTITLPDNGQSAFTFRLNSLFHVRYKKRPLHPVRTTDGVSSYHIAVGATRELVLSYTGTLESTPDCAWLQQSCVLLDDSGVFLDANSHWYPDITGARHRFSMDVTLPKKWVSLSQGRQTTKGWQEGNPQRAIYLLAGAFKVYESQSDPTKPKAMVYLQQSDAKLAQRYLQATHRYLEQYSKLLGEYPYAKFATVESFWETGWGMPSFTMLGSRVMRLPFILHSSFPHEILHNWWGNGVYVDSRDGNWSEGLTAYLADHYNKTSKAERVTYRREALQKYQTYTAAGEDFPLRDFHNRHDRTTQAVGYDKALMLFHMLRKQLGKKRFFAGLKAFYRENRFRFASFTQLQQTFQALMPQDKQELDVFFRQWRDRRGAPQLKVVDYALLPQSEADNDEFVVQLTLQQTQIATDQPFVLDIPLKVQDENGHFNHQTLRMDQAQQQYTLRLKSSARRLFIDPYFDLLRLPDRHEVPALLNVLFNQQSKAFVINGNVTAEQQKAWQAFFTGLPNSENNFLLQGNNHKVFDKARFIVLLGGMSTSISRLPLNSGQVLKSVNDAAQLSGINYRHGQHVLALTLHQGGKQIILLDSGTSEAIKLLARKLPHYGKYSYVLFEGVSGQNLAKGQWPINSSPMALQLETSN